MNTLERIQYHAALSITGAWKGTNLNKIYDELGWEPLTDRRWSRRLFHFFKLHNILTPPYLKTQIPPRRTHLFGSRSVNVLNEIRCKSKNYSNSFYPDSIKCWNNIGPELRNSPNLKSFKVSILSLIRPRAKSIFGIHDPVGIKWLYQLRVGLSPLYAHKLKHNFSDTTKCDTRNSIENLEHFFLQCIRFTEARCALLNLVQSLPNANFESLRSKDKIKLLLYGGTSLSNASNNILSNSEVFESFRAFSVASL